MNCTSENLCVDCTEDCEFAGDIGADCPKGRCDMPEYSCETCPWVLAYVKEKREKK